MMMIPHDDGTTVYGVSFTNLGSLAIGRPIYANTPLSIAWLRAKIPGMYYDGVYAHGWGHLSAYRFEDGHFSDATGPLTTADYVQWHPNSNSYPFTWGNHLVNLSPR